jgi:hypothetical protein
VRLKEFLAELFFLVNVLRHLRLVWLVVPFVGIKNAAPISATTLRVSLNFKKTRSQQIAQQQLSTVSSAKQ